MSDKAKIIFLGTSASTPTKNRNLSSIVIRFGGEWLLFDAPEGTQRQMMKSKVSYLKINNIFISHFHADHFLGLGGLLATMNIHGRDWPMTIYGPKGIKRKVDETLKLAMLEPLFEIKCVEVSKGKIFENELFTIEAVPLKHEIECYGYVFKEHDKPGEFDKAKAIKLGIPIGPLFSELQKGKSVKVNGKTIKPEEVLDKTKARKGKKISIIFDTLPSKNYYKQIEESDILIHEASFLEKLKERANETMHSTAGDAGRIAKETNAKQLILFHLSARHKEDELFENEARQEFANVIVANDLMELEL
ncbi:MAG TPA: ribonuclease Z [archaeon]|nr:ribonuclease Z [archaeon]